MYGIGHYEDVGSMREMIVTTLVANLFGVHNDWFICILYVVLARGGKNNGWCVTHVNKPLDDVPIGVYLGHILIEVYAYAPVHSIGVWATF